MDEIKIHTVYRFLEIAMNVWVSGIDFQTQSPPPPKPPPYSIRSINTYVFRLVRKTLFCNGQLVPHKIRFIFAI